ncbi:hypothetical protein RclHR1_01130005 [Rhizophagus clarus]|uniref:Uncharacterized protein n=1 Tax=Rhizophagus clarus TaxID=94130 RepID=A0A2Z6QG23_9GLOM|nr:hypothetical protein RclHR1_01130005 [Rhizophagus clarus]GES78411.1 hypothetical protein RCL_jg15189.t1 [Rhizophagus clarus]
MTRNYSLRKHSRNKQKRRERLERKFDTKAKNKGIDEPTTSKAKKNWHHINKNVYHFFKPVSHFKKSKHSKQKDLLPFLPKQTIIKKRAAGKPLVPLPPMTKQDWKIHVAKGFEQIDAERKAK